jgi:hypothetical protein
MLRYRHSVRSPRRILAAALAAAALGTASFACDSPTSSKPVTHTFLKFKGDQGDYIASGESLSFTLEDGAWSAHADSNQVAVSVQPSKGGPEWYLVLAAPFGQTLTTGTYENADLTHVQSYGHPGVALFSSRRFCNIATGRFVITELVRNPNGTVDRLHATLEQHCEGGEPAVRGEVGIYANPWK